MSGVSEDNKMYRISDMIIALHNLAREVSIKDFEQGHKVRLLADELARIGNTLHEKETSDARN
jgi:hypothetical protein